MEGAGENAKKVIAIIIFLIILLILGTSITMLVFPKSQTDAANGVILFSALVGAGVLGVGLITKQFDK